MEFAGKEFIYLSKLKKEKIKNLILSEKENKEGAPIIKEDEKEDEKEDVKDEKIKDEDEKKDSDDDSEDNERLIRNGEMAYSFENTMYGTLGPERTVWDEEANEAMKEAVRKQEKQ